MARPQHNPLRALTDEEKTELALTARSQNLAAAQVDRARAILAVASGKTFKAAAALAGRANPTTVSGWVARFNLEGLSAVVPQHGGGRRPVYTLAQWERVRREAARTPEREKDGTANWSLSTLQRSLRQAEDGLPQISRATIWYILRTSGWSWQKSRSWCDTGKVKRKRKAGVAEVIDPDAYAKQVLIERAYRLGEKLGLAVWNEDEAGPFQTIPYGGQSWQPQGQPVRQPHEYIKDGTAKMLTLFHPASGEVRVKGVKSCTNAVLHGWLKEELSQIVATLPPLAEPLLSEAENRAVWESWREGLTVRVSLLSAPGALPPLRMLLIWDNLSGHKTPELLCWLFERGILPLSTPLGGSWLNMAESIQRILKRRALEGEHPTKVSEIIEWLEATARGWNRAPTSFEWGGKRAARRQRAKERQRRNLGGSGAYAPHGLCQDEESYLEAS